MNSSGYEYQQEQQHGYDPSQTQTPSYDQSSQPYYPYNYAQDNQPQPQFQQDPNSTPIAPEQSHSAEPSQAHAGALAQLVGNLDGVPRELIGPSQYRGAGRRGGRSFRGYAGIMTIKADQKQAHQCYTESLKVAPYPPTREPVKPHPKANASLDDEFNVDPRNDTFDRGPKPIEELIKLQLSHKLSSCM
ncbi:hypothetical protein glysoja_046373 [Glycine soja]|uniref:Uncharacterized protein n=1 Tax=Glycine soja TaxID=3848 RepID=A0A0B2NV70_GLYSO|nr:hypothetical protein glysoja_046373 [Glycine soja]